jgi:predicted thioesterase
MIDDTRDRSKLRHRERSVHIERTNDNSEASNSSLHHRAGGVIEFKITADLLDDAEAGEEMLSLATLSSYIEEACKVTALDVLNSGEESVAVSLSVRQLSCVRPGDQIRLRAQCVRDPTSSMIHLHVVVDLGTRLAVVADHSRLIVERGALRDRQQARSELTI